MAAHRDPHEEVDTPSDRRPEALTFAADHEGDRTAQVRGARGERRFPVGARNPHAADMEVRQCAGQIVDRHEQQMLDGSRRCLHRRGRKWRLAVRRKQHAVDANCLGASQQRADVLGVLQRIEDEHERRFAPLPGSSEHLVERRISARPDHERRTLVAVEAGERRERAAFHFDDRDPQARCVEDDLLERHPALWHHE